MTRLNADEAIEGNLGQPIEMTLEQWTNAYLGSYGYISDGVRYYRLKSHLPPRVVILI